MTKVRTSSFRQVHMPDVDPLIVPFITTIVMDKKNQKLIFKEMNRCLLEIQNKRELLIIAKESLTKKQKDLISSFGNIKYPDYPSPKYVWAKQKCQRLYIKYYKCIIKFYESNVKIADALLLFIQNCIDQSAPIKIEMDRFDKETNVGQDKKVDQALSRYTRMNNYVNYMESKGLNETCRYGDIKRSQVWQKMKEIAEEYEQQGPYEGSSNRNRYFPPTEFDELFMKFILITKISDKFKVCVKSMPKYGTYEEFKKLNFGQPSQNVDPSMNNNPKDNLLKHSLKNIQVSIDNFKKEDNNNTENSQNDKNSNNIDSENNSDDDKNNNEEENESYNVNESSKKDNKDDNDIDFIEVQESDDLESKDNEDDNSNNNDIQESNTSKTSNQITFQRKKSVIEEYRLQSLMDQDVDTDHFRNFILSLFRLLKTNKPCTQAMLQLFHCAVIRILFDFYYIENSAVFYGRNLKDFYIEICEEILNESPLQIKINKNFFSDGEENLPIREIITNDPVLLTGSSSLYLIQFLSNPLDIAIQVNRAFRIIQESIDTKNYDRNQNSSVSSGMASDDFINMLKPLYAMNPYVCPNGICRFIELFCELFQLFDTLSYGLTTFSIVLRDIDDMAQNKEKSKYTDAPQE